MLKTTRFDAADHLDTKERQTADIAGAPDPVTRVTRLVWLSHEC